MAITVAELIEDLRLHDPRAIVLCRSGDCVAYAIDTATETVKVRPVGDTDGLYSMIGAPSERRVKGVLIDVGD